MVDGWMHNSNKPCFFQFSLQFKMTFLVPPLISTQIAFNSLPLTSPLIFLLQSSKIKPPSALCSYCNTPERVCLFVFFLFLFCFGFFSCTASNSSYHFYIRILFLQIPHLLHIWVALLIFSVFHFGFVFTLFWLTIQKMLKTLTHFRIKAPSWMVDKNSSF